MINLLLYCKDKSSCLIFKDFCSGDILSSMKPGRSSSFCINNLSFSVMYGGDLYLCSPVLDKRKTSTYLESNCKILNDLFDFNFQILNGRFFIRKDWIANHSKGTIFGKFNRKKDYIFNGKVIKVSRDCKIKSNIQCEVMKYLINLSKDMKSKYRVKTIGKEMILKTSIIKNGNMSILDPSTFVITQ